MSQQITKEQMLQKMRARTAKNIKITAEKRLVEERIEKTVQELAQSGMEISDKDLRTVQMHLRKNGFFQLKGDLDDISTMVSVKTALDAFAVSGKFKEGAKSKLSDEDRELHEILEDYPGFDTTLTEYKDYDPYNLSITTSHVIEELNIFLAKLEAFGKFGYYADRHNEVAKGAKGASFTDFVKEFFKVELNPHAESIKDMHEISYTKDEKEMAEAISSQLQGVVEYVAEHAIGIVE